MEFLSEYKQDFDSNTIISEFRKLKEGEQLPRGGPFDLLYGYISYPGETVLLKGNEGYCFFHIEHDDVIQDIDSETARWHIDRTDHRIVIAILFPYPGGMNRIDLTLESSHSESRMILDQLKSDKKITIYFLNLLYGGIVKDKTAELAIPDEVLGEIK